VARDTMMLLSCAMETSLADARAPHFPALRWSPGIGGRRGERVTRPERRDEARENVQPIAARNPANPHERENLPYQGNAPCVPVRGGHRQPPVACAAARFDRSIQRRLPPRSVDVVHRPLYLCSWGFVTPGVRLSTAPGHKSSVPVPDRGPAIADSRRDGGTPRSHDMADGSACYQCIA
jgi:hypothetical protein